MLGGLGAAANAAQNTTSEFNLTSGFQCQLVLVVPFHISVGISLICVGLLLCTMMALRAVGDSLDKWPRYTFIFVIVVLSIVLIVGLFVSLFVLTFMLNAHELFPITQAVYCNHVLYYWAFVYAVIFWAVVGVIIIVGIVFCIVSLFLEENTMDTSDDILPQGQLD